jgi:GT2 family glycosyltransferase
VSEVLDVSIVIVNWNTRDLLAQCLTSIERHPPSGAYEVWIVDNASADGSQIMVREQFPWVHLIENRENVGFARANNQAIRHSQGRYVLLLNSDAQLARGVLSSMVAFLDADPAAGITGVCVASPDGDPQFCHGSFPSLYTEFRSLFGLHRWDLSCWDRLDAPLEVDWVSGACLMARKAMMDQIGLLDEGFFFFGEEVDLCYRAVHAGWKVFLVPSLPIIHVGAGSMGKSSERLLRLYRGKLYFAAKHMHRVHTKLLLAMIRVSTLGKFVLYSTLSFVEPDLAQRRCLWREVLRETWRGSLLS